MRRFHLLVWLPAALVAAACTSSGGTAATTGATSGGPTGVTTGVTTSGSTSAAASTGGTTSSAPAPTTTAPLGPTVAVAGELQMGFAAGDTSAHQAGAPCTGDVLLGGGRHAHQPASLAVQATGPFGRRTSSARYSTARVVTRAGEGVSYLSCAAAFRVRVPKAYRELTFHPDGNSAGGWRCSLRRAQITGPVALDGTPACLRTPPIVRPAP